MDLFQRWNQHLTVPAMERIPNSERALREAAKWTVSLAKMDVPGFVKFYNECVPLLARYYILILPFEAVSPYLKGGHGFCPPGLGLSKYVKMGNALLLVLELLLVNQGEFIRNQIQYLKASGRGNGYVLLWKICSTCLPLYDPAKELLNPVWPQSNDIYEFATLVRVHRSAQILRGTKMSEYAMCCLFLCSIHHPLYKESSLSLLRAIFEATIEASRDGEPVVPEIMIPLVSARREVELVKTAVDAVAAAVRTERDADFTYRLGVMVETPRATLRAGEIAPHCAFLSFGTNDLTQMTYGLSRDDAGRFMSDYVQQGVFPEDPFHVLDIDGVGELLQLGAERGRKAQPGITLSICGEHGGNPESISFCRDAGFDYVSCSPFRVPVARLAAAQLAIIHKIG